MEIDMIQWIKEHLDIRPFNADGKKDGNFNYIHQQHVLDLLFKLCNQKAVPTSAMHSDGEGRCSTCGGRKNENPWCSDSFHL